MKNCIYFFFALIVSTSGISAQELTVNNTSGKQEKYTLKEVRRILFQDGEIRLASTSDRLVKAYPYADVEYVHIGGFPTEVVPVWNETGKVAFHNNTKSLYVSFDAAAEKVMGNIGVKISSIGGATLKYWWLSSETDYPLFAFSVDISGLTPGAYIVTLTFETKKLASFKFIK